MRGEKTDGAIRAGRPRRPVSGGGLTVLQAAVLVAAAVLFFWWLGGHDLWAPDEPYFAEGAREMVVDGHWLVLDA